MNLANIIGIGFNAGGVTQLPLCARDLAVSWHKNLNQTVDLGGTYPYVKDAIGGDVRDVYYGQHLTNASGQINFYRSSGTFDYKDPSTGTLVEEVSIPADGLYTVPTNGICDVGIYPREGIVEGVLDFDGVDDYVELSTTPDVTGNKTISFNAYITSSNISNCFMINFVSSLTDGFVVSLNSNLLRFSPSNDPADCWTIRTDSLVNTFLNIVVTKGVGEITSITINGVSYTDYGTGGYGLGTGGNYIGAFAGGFTLSDAYVWNINVNNDHLFIGFPNGNTNSAWDDTIGSITATVNGTPSVTTLIDQATGITYASFYPVCERAGTVLHDVMQDSKHISVFTPTWAESLHGSDYLNQYGYVTKTESDTLGYAWETNVFGSPTTLNNNVLVPLAKWNYEDLQDNTGENILDSSGEQIQVKVNI